MISVVIPVGPNKHHQDYLQEALQSIAQQSLKPTCVVIVDDMANVSERSVASIVQPVRFCYAPWRLGVPAAFNMGIAMAPDECVFMMGADDTLEPDCLGECITAYSMAERPDTSYFWVGVHYMGNEYPDQYLPCHAAMVTKSLWRHNGGFQPETAVGAPDAALISTMLANQAAGNLVCVNHAKTLYNYRVHENSDTASRARWQGIIIESRNILTEDWKRPEWGRFA